MNVPVSSIRLRAVLRTLTVFLTILTVDGGAGASICWSGEQNVALGLGPGMNITYFDLNGDGTDDFGFRNYEGTLSLVPVGGNSAAADPTWQPGHLNYRPLAAGTPIGEALPGAFVWDGDENFLVSYMDVGGSGPWHGVQYGLLGVSLETNGQTHYGWIRMSGVSQVTFILHDWAYERRPDAAIKAGAGPGLMAAPEVVRPGYLRLKWRREGGKSYRVQATTCLDAPTWRSAFLFGVWITPTEMAVEVRMEGAAQFFRVIEAD
jgi:hypothetical protein